jgi:glycosyltransferase involved in cell wall biosynthesis
MATVSVLVPAFRPHYLDVAIASVLAQTYKDFELIISDDSSDEAVASVVSKWTDARIRLVRNPNRQLPSANRDYLLSLATGKYIKFLFDDDFLLSRSLEGLVNIAEETGSEMLFHGRHFVDERGVVLSSSLVVEEGKYGFLDKQTFFNKLIGETHNFVGEPSNVLFKTDAFRTLDRPFAIGGIPMRFLTDVALYANFLRSGYSVIAVGFVGSAFRRHSRQNSNAASPIYSAGLFEWELLLRWARDCGELGVAQYELALAKLHAGYRHFASVYPELLAFLELEGRPGDEGYLSTKFRQTASLGYMAIEMRQIQ